MSEQANLEIIKEAYAAFERGDIPAVLRAQDPDTRLEIAGPSDIPWAGRFRGHEGAIKYFALIEAEAEIEAFDPHTFLAQGDKVVVLGYEKIRSKRTGRSYETHWVHELTLVNGKIINFREHCDTAAVAAAFRNE
jgi:ketosteroid isomerase-like protein